MFVCLIKRSLGFHHTSQSQVGGTLSCLLWILINTAHTLITNIKNEANNLWGLSEKGTSLNDIFVIKFCGCWVLIELETALDITEVIVLVFQEPTDHFGQVLLVLLR